MASIRTSRAVWEIPEPVSECEIRLDDHSVTMVRQHGNPAGPRLVLSHGNGLAIDLYLPFWSLLADDFELMAWICGITAGTSSATGGRIRFLF